MASILDRIKYSLSNIGYQNKLPGLGISQSIGTPYSPARTPSQVYNRAGSPYALPNTNNSIARTNTPPISYASNFNGAITSPTTKTVASTPPGVSAGGGGGGGGGGSVLGTMDQGMFDRAQGSYGSALDAIKARLGMIRDIAQRNMGTAKSVRDEIVGNISNTYSGLRDYAGKKKDTAIENLNQEDLGVQNTYGQAEGTARKAFESALLQNRMRARAMNRLDSSFYDDRQADTTNQAASTVSGLQGELAGKRSAIGTRKTDVANDFEKKALDLAAEEGQLKSQADREYQDKVDAASDMERSYGIDSAEAAAMAEEQYQSRLDAIEQYIRGKDMQLSSIAGAGSNQRAAIDSYNHLSPELSATLSNARGLNAAKSMALPTFSNVTQSNANPLAFTGQGANGSAFEQLQKLLGNYLIG